MMRFLAWMGLLSLAWNGAAVEVSFRNDVMGVLSKAGCNAGTCHGNKNGKGGFRLSLRGQDPEQDWLSLTRDVQGRRVNPMAPEQSLILLKPTMELSHEGGKRFAKGSDEYEVLRQWVEAGMGDDIGTAPRLERIEVVPRDRVLVEPESSVQLKVEAYFSDGTTRDMTKRAVYETSNDRIKVSPDGRVERRVNGESTVLVRYLNAQEPVSLAFVPARPEFQWPNVAAKNYVDEFVLAKLRRLRMTPSDLCSDPVFLRRAYLDLLGITPSAEEARVFLFDGRPDKRALLIESLLAREEFADYWALKWADLLRNEAHSLDQKGVQNFHHWIRRSIAENKPLDQFARDLITARGSTYADPAANYYRPHRDAPSRAKAAAQVFLGRRLQCAECHNHPFDRWTQDDYYDWAALFAQVNYKVLQNNREIGSDKHEWNGEQVVYLARKAALENPRTGRPATPRFLGESGKHPEPESDYLTALGRWLTSAENPFFAKTQANRIWYHLMGRGLVDPVDDFRATNPASHPELLDALAADLSEHGFDLRYLIRVIMNSRAYQTSAEPNETNYEDEMNYSHQAVRRMTAEQLLDCQSWICGTPLRFAGYPAGLRAGQLPGVRPESKGKRRANAVDQFLEVFGKPPRLMTSETERSCECNLGQAMQLISGPTVNEMLAAKDNRLGEWLAGGKSNGAIVEELYWWAFSQAPRPEELERFARQLDRAVDRRAELEDIAWAMLNSAEFLFRQ